MRTALLAPGYLGEQPAEKDALGNDRVKRAQKYVEFYKRLLPRLGAEWMFFCDNGSSIDNLRQVGGLLLDPDDGECTILDVGTPVTHILYPNVKKTSVASYPYCWRAQWEIKNLLTKWGYDKVIFIDSDFYLISKRMIDWARSVQNGWHTVQCRKYMWPAPELQVVVGGCQKFMDFTSGDWLSHDGKCMELTLPFTFIHGEFNYGRYGEDRVPQKPDMDAYGQCPLDLTIEVEA